MSNKQIEISNISLQFLYTILNKTQAKDHSSARKINKSFNAIEDCVIKYEESRKQMIDEANEIKIQTIDGVETAVLDDNGNNVKYIPEDKLEELNKQLKTLNEEVIDIEMTVDVLNFIKSTLENIFEELQKIKGAIVGRTDVKLYNEVYTALEDAKRV